MMTCVGSTMNWPNCGSLAHEIKNPLSVIHMNADLLSEELSESEWPGRRRAEAKVDMIRQQCQRNGKPPARLLAVLADARPGDDPR